jgi:hypothetical protein
MECATVCLYEMNCCCDDSFIHAFLPQHSQECSPLLHLSNEVLRSLEAQSWYRTLLSTFFSYIWRRIALSYNEPIFILWVLLSHVQVPALSCVNSPPISLKKEKAENNKYPAQLVRGP